MRTQPACSPVPVSKRTRAVTHPCDRQNDAGVSGARRGTGCRCFLAGMTRPVERARAAMSQILRGGTWDTGSRALRDRQNGSDTADKGGKNGTFHRRAPPLCHPICRSGARTVSPPRSKSLLVMIIPALRTSLRPVCRKNLRLRLALALVVGLPRVVHPVTPMAGAVANVEKAKVEKANRLLRRSAHRLSIKFSELQTSFWTELYNVFSSFCQASFCSAPPRISRLVLKLLETSS